MLLSAAAKRALLFAAATFFLTALTFPGGGAGAADAETSIRIGGTGSALGGMMEVARAFQKKHPDIGIKFIPSLGSGGGIKAVLSGSLDLALSARPLNDAEKARGATGVEYARTPFVFATAHDVKGRSFTLHDIAAIYGGETKTWPDGTLIRPVLRPHTETDLQLLRIMSPEMDIAVQKAMAREGMIVATTDQENADMLTKVKGAFGATTLAQVLSEKRRLRLLPLDNVSPGVKELAEGSYPHYKVYFAVTGPRSTDGTRLFLEFLKAAPGRAILTRTGHLVPRRSP